nr:MAG TPA: cleavage stimulation factor domain protein [Caudoviricetes sp.]
MVGSGIFNMTSWTEKPRCDIISFASGLRKKGAYHGTQKR